MLYESLCLIVISVILVVGVFVGPGIIVDGTFPGTEEGIYAFVQAISNISIGLSDSNDRTCIAIMLLCWLLMLLSIAFLSVEYCVVFLGAGFMIVLGILGFAFTFLFIPDICPLLLPYFIGVIVFSIAYKRQEEVGYSPLS